MDQRRPGFLYDLAAAAASFLNSGSWVTAFFGSQYMIRQPAHATKSVTYGW